jgi:hypothetical protein
MLHKANDRWRAGERRNTTASGIYLVTLISFFRDRKILKSVFP